MWKKVFIYALGILLLTACNEYVPKPIGYSRIDIKESSYKEYDNKYFSFLLSTQAYIDTVHTENDKTSLWFNIVYPDYNVRIYCSYFAINKSTLKQALEDSHHLAYSHVLKADGIDRSLFASKKHSVSGAIYDIGGNVATPIQFFLTDSIANFFRGSFYYDIQTKSDSVAPVTEFIRNDIVELMGSFVWK